MRCFRALLFVLSPVLGLGSAIAAECPGNPNALGVSRTIVVDPEEHSRLGAFQYRESLPLNDKEVVLTFDDGPLPPYTTRILETLASECVKATFFMVGRMVRGYPNIVRRVYNEGHTIANHSQNHPFNFHKMTVEQAAKEIEDGHASLQAVLGDPKAIAPFFRIPGLLRQESVENYLTQHDIMTWSVDFVADDWTHISAHEVVRRAVNRIEARGKGILLLHDIQPATALGLPDLLKELKIRGFKIVQVVPATPDRPKTVTEPEQWSIHSAPPSIWPRTLVSNLDLGPPELEAPSPQSFGVATGQDVPVELMPSLQRVAAAGDVPLPPAALWPRSARYEVPVGIEALPVPGAQNFRYSRTWRPVRTPAASTRTAARKEKPSTTGSTTTGNSSVVHTTSAKDHKPTRKPIGHQLTVPSSRPAAGGKPTASLLGPLFGTR